MESPPLSASQDSVSTLMTADTLGDQENTSTVTRSCKSNSSKPKAQPTVTPRTFIRFFTPRSSLSRSSKIGASRQALRDITTAAANHNQLFQQPSPAESSPTVLEDACHLGVPTRKRRKISSPDVSAVGSSPSKRVSALADDLLRSSDVEHDSESDGDVLDQESAFSDAKVLPSTLQPIRRSTQRGPIGGLLFREMGSSTAKQIQSPVCNVSDWQYETANFHSAPEDSHLCEDLGDPTQNALPFCSASCNTNSLVAIGDEEGGVRLLETFRDGKPPFHKPHLAFRPHTNAILDLSFSPDDRLLATASGDQTSQIIDMPSQRAIHTLAAHKSSVKQVKFQPGSSSVIATSSRDGSVRIWDLRCKGSETPAHELRISLDGPEDSNASKSSTKKMTYGRCVDTIVDAHSYRGASFVSSKASLTDQTYDMPSRTEGVTRHGDISVTAISFLSPRHEHLLITTSEGDATVKLWDLRTTHSHRRSTDAIPLSSTRQPDGHAKYRYFGVTSLALNSDSSRLYTLCRDNTIYAYSTSHLILGHAPELASTSASSANSSTRKSRFARTTEKPGLGPIYGFRHHLFHATTFYVKISVRPAKGSQTELLAAGSSDGCAIIWPTDERYMRHYNPHAGTSCAHFRAYMHAEDPCAFPSPSKPSIRGPLPRTKSRARLHDTIPIYDHGTALVRGHDREVTGLSWAYGGELVTASDDFTARCWREDQGKARDLRTGGETEGRRWGCGWADVQQGWDDD
ncbi:MAG: hypothetical protein LQ343_006574 [Gyalolechia ehrenbergii]|nr:MAG: hypothetical protein LQ343_006574 [Gyalolechia ehrenbergii]